jgi:hypothetical protein
LHQAHKLLTAPGGVAATEPVRAHSMRLRALHAAW